ncbi:MAG: hypothetical protein ACLSAF_15395 [Intestinimonas sp.]
MEQFLPRQPVSRYAGGLLTWPEDIKFKIKTWMGSKKPCHLIVTGTKINLYCTIERFDCDEEGGAVGDMNYSITFKEYRQPTIRQVKVDAAAQTASVPKTEERTDNTVAPKTYNIVSGDCLYNIAKSSLATPANGLKSPP